MLGLAVSALFMFLGTKRKAMIALALAPFIFAGILWAPDSVFERAETIGTYEQDSSAMQRIHTWILAWNVAVESPVTGAGFDFEDFPNPVRWFSYGAPDIFQYTTIIRAAHSIYFQMLGQHGFVAFGLYLFLIFSTLWTCRRLAKRATGHPELEWIRNYASAIQVSLIAYMVSGAFVSVAYFDLAWVYYSFTAILNRELPKHAGATQKLAPSGKGARPQPAARVGQAPSQSPVGSAHGRNARV